VAFEDYDGVRDDSIVIPSAINVIVGVWLAVSPLVLDYRTGDPVFNDIACGLAIAVLAYLRAARAARTPLLSWANVALGAWLFTAGLVLDADPMVAVNESISGGLVFVLALMSALTARD
jgi:hypothetical protein